MGKVYFGLGLTLLVSLLVLLGGGFLARRSVTRVTEVDRSLLQSLSEEIETVALALREKRGDALGTMAFELSRPMPEEVEEELQKLPGVRGAFLFEKGIPRKKWVLLGPIGSRSPAEVVVEGRKLPLNPGRAVVVPTGEFEDLTFGQSGRLDNEEGSFYGRWFSPLQGVVCLFLIEDEVAQAHFVRSVGEQVEVAFERVKLAGEVMTVLYAGNCVKRIRGSRFYFSRPRARSAMLWPGWSWGLMTSSGSPSRRVRSWRGFARRYEGPIPEEKVDGSRWRIL